MNTFRGHCVPSPMRYPIPALILAAFMIAAVTTAATPAQACYDWQLYTCDQPEAATILGKDRSVKGYIQPDGAILGKDRRIQGYIESDGTVLGKDRSIRGYVEPRDSLTVEGLPERYRPTLD